MFVVMAERATQTITRDCQHFYSEFCTWSFTYIKYLLSKLNLYNGI